MNEWAQVVLFNNFKNCTRVPMNSGLSRGLLARKKSLISTEINLAFVVDKTLLKKCLINIRSAESVLISCEHISLLPRTDSLVQLGSDFRGR